MYIILNPIKIPDDCDIIIDGVNYAGYTASDSHWSADGALTLIVAYSEHRSYGKDLFGNSLGSSTFGQKAVTLSVEQTTNLQTALKRAEIKDKEEQIKRLQAELEVLHLSATKE